MNNKEGSWTRFVLTYGGFVLWVFAVTAIGVLWGGTGLIISWAVMIIVFFPAALLYMRHRNRQDRA